VMSNIQKLTAANAKVGDSYETVVVDDLTRTQIVMYAGASGDYNPLHTDDLFTKEVAGYPSVFAHGMLSMGLTGRAVTDWVGDGRLTKYGVRFSRQVWPGDTLTTTLRVESISDSDLAGAAPGEKIADLHVSTKNQNGEEVVVGYAAARLT
jgi:acyl dehydratase